MNNKKKYKALKPQSHREVVHSKTLSANTPQKLGKTPPITMSNEESYKIDYFHFYESLYRKELTDWQDARIIRHDPFKPMTFAIQQLYKDAMLDNHLFSCIRDRVLAVVNKQFLIKDNDGNIDVELSRELKKKWFKQIVKEALKSKFFGYSTLMINKGVQGKIIEVKHIPRESVIPEHRIILKNPMVYSDEKVHIDDFPNFLIHIELGDDKIGELERVAPMTIFKRHSWAAWDEFEQIFGLPIRIAKTMINTKKHKDDLQLWLENMGKSSYGIFDKRVDLEIKESSQRDSYHVFDEKIKRVNSEISKSVVGQTMTKDDGSSRAQGEVHLEVLQALIDADIADVEEWVTDSLFPVMRAWGYAIPEGYYLDIVANTSMKITEKINIDSQISAMGFNLDKDYIENTYEVKLDEDNPRRENPENYTGLSFLA